MHCRKLNNHLYQIDLEPMGIENFIASYVLTGRKTIIVETGPTTSVKNLLEGLDQIGVEKDDVDYVAVSHIHIDHGGGAGTLLQHLPNARLLVHARGAPNLARPKKLWTQTKQVLGEIADMYGRIHPVPEKRILVARDGMTISLGEGITLKVLETLGHASHHLSFYESKGEGIFTGDAAGVYLKSLDVVIPTSPPPFHLEIALRSIAHLKKMLPERLYYTHFGMRENGVQRLEDYVNQLELWAKVVQEGMKAGEDLEGIYKRILEEDPSTRKAADLIRKHMVLRRGVVRQSIQGLMGYFEETG